MPVVARLFVAVVVFLRHCDLRGRSATRFRVDAPEGRSDLLLQHHSRLYAHALPAQSFSKLTQAASAVAHVISARPVLYGALCACTTKQSMGGWMSYVPGIAWPVLYADVVLQCHVCQPADGCLRSTVCTYPRARWPPRAKREHCQTYEYKFIIPCCRAMTCPPCCAVTAPSRRCTSPASVCRQATPCATRKMACYISVRCCFGRLSSRLAWVGRFVKGPGHDKT
jgi:hypothetical protein